MFSSQRFANIAASIHLLSLSLLAHKQCRAEENACQILDQGFERVQCLCKLDYAHTVPVEYGRATMTITTSRNSMHFRINIAVYHSGRI